MLQLARFESALRRPLGRRNRYLESIEKKRPDACAIIGRRTHRNATCKPAASFSAASVTCQPVGYRRFHRQTLSRDQIPRVLNDKNAFEAFNLPAGLAGLRSSRR